MGREDAEKCGIKVERQRRQRPDRQEDDLAPQVVANLDFLLVLVSRLVNLVVVFRLKEEVPDLPAGHRHDPSDQSRHRLIREHHRVRTEKADSAQQGKRLIDPAVVIEAVVVPTLHSKGLEKALHISSPCCAWMSMLWRFDESAVTDARMPGAGELLTAIGSDQAAACAAGSLTCAAVVLPAFAKRINEKCPNGGIARRSTSRTPCERPAQCS